MKCPCADCEVRISGCHDKCAGYSEWKAEHDKKMAWLHEQNRPFSTHSTKAFFDKVRHNARYKGRSGKTFD